ncbi:hypothetical protein QUB68_18500 [Microcoleus sp. A006_D1]|uniref:hypothetical protein n=1 Tax=Microcoleus sp. A006_D1 TaxID=3055267 RepID=UPI002FD70B9C
MWRKPTQEFPPGTNTVSLVNVVAVSTAESPESSIAPIAPQHGKFSHTDFCQNRKLSACSRSPDTPCQIPNSQTI